MQPSPLRVLVVDDATDYASMVAEFVRFGDAWRDALVDIAASYDAALQKFRTAMYDVAFFDYWLGSHDGLSLLREIRRQEIETPVIVMTGRGAEEVAVDAMKAGASDYLGKTNVTPETVGAAIRHALALSGQERQRRHAEAAVRANEELFRALVENTSDVLLLVDRQARITYVTQSSERHLGWKSVEMLGRSVFDFLHPDDREFVSARVAETLRQADEAVPAELRVRHADGTWRSMEGVGVNRLNEPSVGAVVVTARDVTERRRLEDQLRQAHKMEAVGRLAGGIAHDFNNVLTAILGYCNLLLDEVPPSDPLRADVEEIYAAGERAARLTRHLLAFSRRQMLLPQVVDINSLVEQMRKLLRRLVGEKIELSLTLAPDLRAVRADPASIEQVLVNLIMNARDAMPAGGRAIIETANVDLDASYVETHPVVVPGPYVMFAVCDTGEGMDQATRARVFEPFFTTKEDTKGASTGLGLATAYGIVKQSGGYIWVYSEPGHGTIFKVYLPPITAVPAVENSDPGVEIQKRRGWETILLVENEDPIRALGREVLRGYGYVVLEARHGLEALRISERHRDPIHLLITDMVMPHMSGRDLADQLSVDRPALKVLFMSGYSEQAVMPAQATRPTAFIQKPFTPDAFASSVRRILDRETTGLVTDGV